MYKEMQYTCLDVYLHGHTQNRYHTVTISNSYPHRSISIPRSPARPDALDSPFVDVSLGRLDKVVGVKWDKVSPSIIEVNIEL